MTDDDIALAHALADAAGEAIRPYWRGALGTETKADDSPVTLADRAAEAAIRDILEERRPGDGIVGEEYGATREGAERVWVLDPIDGTRSFIAGRPIFGTLIALTTDGGRPELGVIDQPITGERWIGARGRPTMLNGRAIRARRCETLAEAHVGTTSPAAFPGSDLRLFETVAERSRDVLWGGDCYNYGLVAAGSLDAVIESGLKLHDFAALVPIVEGAGGRMTDWSGRPLHAGSDGRVVAVGDAALLEEVLGFLA